MFIIASESYKKILKVREFDLTYLSKTPGTFYVCRDTNKSFKDIDDNGVLKREEVSIYKIATELGRVHHNNPVNGKLYYVWETNELWLFSLNKWKLLIGNPRFSSGYSYNTSSSKLEDTNDGVVDNNGLLKDGSVVVRDNNRIIKGKLYIDETNNNLVISSFMGGGFRILPNGSSTALGSLIINPNMMPKFRDRETGDIALPEDVSNYIQEEYDRLTEEEKENPLARQEILQSKYETIFTQSVDGYALYNGQLNVADEIYVVRTVSIPGPDGDYITEKTKYKVFHEGDLEMIGRLSANIDDGSISDSILY